MKTRFKIIALGFIILGFTTINAEEVNNNNISIEDTQYLTELALKYI